MNKDWIAVDLDGTLAHYDKWISATDIGKPIRIMVDRVKRWLDEGKDVRIFTARVWPIGTMAGELDRNQERYVEATRALRAIQKWCRENIGEILPITCIKDPHAIEFWDDRAVAIEKNKGYETTRGVATAIEYTDD